MANLRTVVIIGIDCDGKHGQRGGERDRGRGRIGRANESKSDDDERGTSSHGNGRATEGGREGGVKE